MTIDALKKWREDHGITQQGLADLLGVTIVTVGRWEVGMRKIPPFLHLALIGLEADLKPKEKSKKRGR